MCCISIRASAKPKCARSVARGFASDSTSSAPGRDLCTGTRASAATLRGQLTASRAARGTSRGERERDGGRSGVRRSTRPPRVWKCARSTMRARVLPLSPAPAGSSPAHASRRRRNLQSCLMPGNDAPF